MEFFKIDFFIGGIICFYSLCCLIILATVYARVFSIGINGYYVFSNTYFELHSTTVKGIRFILGWLPIFVGVSFLQDEDNVENEPLDDYRKDLYLCNKPKPVKVGFKLLPFLSVFILFIIAFLLFFGNQSIDVSLATLYNYFLKMMQLILGDNTLKENFIINTHQILENRSVIIFFWMIVILFYMLLNALFLFFDILIPTKKWIVIFTMWIINIFLFWKLAALLNAFYSIQQILLMFFNIFIGLYVAGIPTYFLTIFFARKLK